jgi:hypothetical protein
MPFLAADMKGYCVGAVKELDALKLVLLSDPVIMAPL